jgi:hypothetical protein
MAFRFLGPRGPSIGGTTNGGTPPRSYTGGPTAREIALENEVRTLRAEQARLVEREREAANNLANIHDSLDVLAGEIDRRGKATRDYELRENGGRLIARAKRIASDRGGRNIQPATLVSLIKAMVGLERPTGWIKVFLDEAAERTSSPRRQPQPVTLAAQEVIDAGAAARGERDSIDIRTGRPRPLSSPLTGLDPVAREIVRLGRRARNEPDE